jgi:uncharacterized protein with von Willebrand factor type A (vWA) domain
MERTLTNFVRALRSAGAAVSSAEAIDAARTLALVGFDDRERMKDALRIVLAKTEEETALYEHLFEAYFSQTASHEQARREPIETAGDDRTGDTGDPNGTGQDGAQGFVALARSNDPNRIAAAMARAGAAAGVDDIRFASQIPVFMRRMLEQLGVDTLERRIEERLPGPSAQARAEAQALIAARAAMQRHARAFVEQRFELFGRSASESFMNDVVVHREIGQLGLRDMERMKAVVAKMARRLAVRHSRRQRIHRRGTLDIRRTLRANAGHEGVPVELVWKRRRKDRPKIVAICDVSGSVSRYVRFLLLFLHTLKDEVADLAAFAFSGHLKDVGRELETMSFEQAMEHIITRVGAGSTDYGQALTDLQTDHWDVIDRRTTILVLGDGRSNHADPRLDIFQDAAARAKRLVWLCPEPPNRWGTGDSCMLQYRPYCTHLSYCATALDLERAIDEVLTAYD